MLTKDQGVFLQSSASPELQALHPALVRDVATPKVTVQCDGDFTSRAGEQVNLYFERHRRFVRAPMRVDTQVKHDPNAILILEGCGKVVSADRREHPRFCAADAGVLATFGSEPERTVHEISASGFSLTAGAHYYLGSMIQTSLTFADRTFNGRACVQSVHETGAGLTRYGLHCALDPESEPLRAGLRFICQTIERRHLAALRGTG